MDGLTFFSEDQVGLDAIAYWALGAEEWRLYPPSSLLQFPSLVYLLGFLKLKNCTMSRGNIFLVRWAAKETDR